MLVDFSGLNTYRLKAQAARAQLLLALMNLCIVPAVRLAMSPSNRLATKRGSSGSFRPRTLKQCRNLEYKRDNCGKNY
uniref:Uncharacterized protein n=1 Tax=Romanomermis culicivorax TaxID=13658 RepID=A0A915KPJ3_ROMCU